VDIGNQKPAVSKVFMIVQYYRGMGRKGGGTAELAWPPPLNLPVTCISHSTSKILHAFNNAYLHI